MTFNSPWINAQDSSAIRRRNMATRWLGRYLSGTRDRGTILTPVPGKDLEVFVDASFCGDWDAQEAARDRDTARSRHGYVIRYASCPLLWKSQLQTEIAMSFTESEYTGLSYALRDAIAPRYGIAEGATKDGFPNRDVAGSPTLQSVRR